MLALLLFFVAQGAEPGPAVLDPFAAGDLRFFASPRGDWGQAASVRPRPGRPHELEGAAGRGVVWNGRDGRTHDLVTAFEHGDVALHVEFLVPEGSNSGIYFMGRYELQILDSHGVETPTHGDCGGIYQRWDPGRGAGHEGYEGVAPRVNAAKRPGEWQTFEVVFRAPRFDAAGEKTAGARFERVVHNGVRIHEDVELGGPTRGGYAGEVPLGPLRFQGDHGPVAYRNLRLRSLSRSVDPPFGSAGHGLEVLVFSRTAGFRHDSIPAGVALLEELGGEHGFRVQATEDPGWFTPERLRHLDVVVFLNTTGDVLDAAGQEALRAWYRDGGGFLGVHAAADTEYDWPWYGELVGARFRTHPAVQTASAVVADPDHPATAHLDTTWIRRDEWYDFREPPPPGCRPLLLLQEQSYVGGTMGARHPIAWCRPFDGGRTIYLGGGHTEASYREPAFRAHVLGALLWAAGRAD